MQTKNSTAKNICIISLSGPPKLEIHLGSSVSSVSDPDVSGMSNSESAKRQKQVKAAKPDENATPADENESDGRKLINLSLLESLSKVLRDGHNRCNLF